MLVRQKCVQKCRFLSLVKKRFPLVNDNEQGPSGGEGGVQRKNDNVFIERKDDILLSCKQISNC